MSSSAVRIASLRVSVGTALLPLGQVTSFQVIAKDAAGRVITGTYDRPIVLRAKGLQLSAMRVATSDQASALNASWIPSHVESSGTIAANADGHTANARVTAGTGFVYYDAGNDPKTDVTGFQIVASAGGRLFYGTLGPQVCSGVICSSAQGAIGELDPRTGKARQIALPSEVLGLLPTSDGALWIAGGAGHLLYRMSPGPLATPAAIVVPPPAHAMSWGPRLLAQDAGGNVWFGDADGHRLLSIPLAGPYQESSISVFAPPNGPSGTPQAPPYVNGLAYGTDGNLYFADYDNGVLDRVSPSNGKTTHQLLLPQQVALGTKTSAQPRFLVSTPSGLMLSLFGSSTKTSGAGAIDGYAYRSALSFVKLPSVPAGSIPDSLSAKGSLVYYADVFTHALGVLDVTSRKSRLIPTQPFLAVDQRVSPNGVAAMADGSAWFTCENNATPLQPVCIGHTVYLSDWSLFPGPAFNLGLGRTQSQVVGIMESPSQDSGPFAARSSTPKICSVSTVADHNFVVTGKTGGRCTVTVTDAKRAKRKLDVLVVAP
ncbi:MAG: hypothetical protein JO241_09670 [Candidatus Eremiobacteraeota bacterium]|nr:hypothetical protein [Candidatus Eremiobacteraeota bacterium]